VLPGRDAAGLGRKAAWSLAGHAGEAAPDGMQRQYTGTAGKITNCQPGVSLAYASPAGRHRADALAAKLPRRAWQRLRCGDGSGCSRSTRPSDAPTACQAALGSSPRRACGLVGALESPRGHVALQAADDLFPAVPRRSLGGAAGGQARACGQEATRVRAMRCGARLAWRSPPRDSRCRRAFPDGAGTGQGPRKAAKAASGRGRPGLPPQVISSRAAVPGPAPRIAGGPAGHR
jgi:hypothetical protein